MEQMEKIIKSIYYSRLCDQGSGSSKERVIQYRTAVTNEQASQAVSINLQFSQNTARHSINRTIIHCASAILKWTGGQPVILAYKYSLN